MRLFFENMTTAGLQVLTLFLLIAVGFLLDKTGVFPEKAARGCTDLLFYAVTPAVMLQSFLSMEYNRERLFSFFPDWCLPSAHTGYSMRRFPSFSG